MSWFDAIPAILTAIIFLMAPGAPVALATGARGIGFVAISVAGSVSAIGVSAVVAPLVGVPFGPLTPFLMSAPVALAGFLLRKLWLRRIATPAVGGEWGRPFIAALGGVAAGAAVIGISVVAGIPHADWPSQTYDAIFHLNGVQHILQTGNGSSLNFNVSSPDSPNIFYPAAWHDLAALVSQVSGVGIVVAANVTSAVIAAFVWPVGCVFLVRQIAGRQKAALLLAGVLSAGFAAFPLLLLQFGVLYPNLLGFALIPFGLGLTVMAMGLSREPELEWPARWMLLLWALAGLGLAHPNAVFGLMVLAAPAVIVGSVRHLRDIRRGVGLRAGYVAILSLCVMAAIAAAVIWTKGTTNDNSWRAYQTTTQALGEAFFNGPEIRPAALAVTTLVIVALAVALSTRTNLWLVASYLLSITLFVVASAGQTGVIRTAITGPWYNDSFRLAAMLPITAVPLATLGALYLVRRLQRFLGDRRFAGRAPDRRGQVRIAAAVIVAALVIPLSQGGPAMATARRQLAANYNLSNRAPLLTPDEIAIFRVVQSVTPASAVIAGNPWSGSALVYAYTGRQALFPHVGGSYPPERWAIAQELDDDATAICAAIRDEKVEYVLDFGTRYLFGSDPRSTRYPGFDELAGSNAVKLVAQRGDAKLYKVTACGLG